MSTEIDLFIREFLRELQEDNAAVFAGAGLSVPAGYVDWAELLRPIAEELNLDVEQERDLVSLAQYHCNENGGNRHRINQLLIDKFSAGAAPTENHRLLAKLPISVYWTTNYDRLIESALTEAGKIVDVKYSIPQLATTRLRRDAVVYKMHGDIEHPHDAVLTKDDYERYHIERGAFINALSGDLVSRTFLFLGFSFSDPNLDYILSRVRIAFRENQRRHYCIFRRVHRVEGQTEAEFAHAQIRQTLLIADLKRFNIKTLLVEEYSEITDLLARIERLYRQRTVFISGSAAEFGPWSQDQTEGFLRDFSRALVTKGYRIATGVGVGVGDAVITGAIERVYTAGDQHVDDAVIMRPFPRAHPDATVREQVWEEYRQDLISRAGIAIFLLGNKMAGENVVLADGVRREFEIAREHGLSLLPIGCSGYVAGELWQEVMSSFERFYPAAVDGMKECVARLGEPVADPHELISVLLDAVQLTSGGR